MPAAAAATAGGGCGVGWLSLPPAALLQLMRRAAAYVRSAWRQRGSGDAGWRERPECSVVRVPSRPSITTDGVARAVSLWCLQSLASFLPSGVAKCPRMSVDVLGTS